MARVVYTRKARRQLNDLDVRIVDAVLDAEAVLESDPFAGRRLRGRFTGLWSLRIGSYRIVYELRDSSKTVRIFAVLHRSVSYRTDPRG